MILYLLDIIGIEQKFQNLLIVSFQLIYYYYHFFIFQLDCSFFSHPSTSNYQSNCKSLFDYVLLHENQSYFLKFEIIHVKDLDFLWNSSQLMTLFWSLKHEMTLLIRRLIIPKWYGHHFVFDWQMFNQDFVID